MYNEDLKRQFIHDVYNDKQLTTQALCLFEKMGNEHETPLDTDIGSMDAETLISVMNQKDYITCCAVRTDLRIINGYRKWWAFNVLHEYKVRNDIRARDIELKNGMRNSLVFDSIELEAAKDNFPVENGYAQPIIVILAWLGLSIKEILTVKENEVLISGDTISVYGASVTNASLAETMRYWISHNAFPRGRKIVYKAEGDAVIRRVLSENHSLMNKPIPTTFVPDALHAAYYDTYPKLVSVVSLNAAGNMLRIYESELAGHEITKSDFANAFKTNVDRRLADYLIEYEAYKEAKNSQ